MTTMLMLAIDFALGCFGVAFLVVTVRLLIGPSAQDRVMALDALYGCATLITLVLGMRFGSQVYFEVALLISLVGFVGSIAMAKFLLRGEVIE